MRTYSPPWTKIQFKKIIGSPSRERLEGPVMTDVLPRGSLQKPKGVSSPGPHRRFICDSPTYRISLSVSCGGFCLLQIAASLRLR